MSTTSNKSTSKPKADQPEGISVKQLAEKLKGDPKDLRKWLRAEGKGLGGRGKRYSFTPAQVRSLTAAWKKAQEKDAADEG